jgi:hypothetical protein
MKNNNESVNPAGSDSRDAITAKKTEMEQILSAAMNGLAVHGEKYRMKNGQEGLRLKPDLDSMVCIKLLDIAAIEYPQVTFVQKGESVPGQVNLDTGERQNFTIEDDGTIFFDHHGPDREERGESNSAAKIVYEKLLENNLIPPGLISTLDKLVDFVTGIDNADYPIYNETPDYRTPDGKTPRREPGEIFKRDWSSSLYGLQRFISFNKLYEYIAAGRDPMYPFTDEEIEKSREASEKMKKLTGEGLKLFVEEEKNKEKEFNAPPWNLFELYDKQQKSVDKCIEGAQSVKIEMIRAGIRTVEKYLGRTVFNTVKMIEFKNGKRVPNNRIPIGFDAVRGLGYDSYVIWSEEKNTFFITSRFHLGRYFDEISKRFPGSKIIRGTMIIYPKNDTAEENKTAKEDLLKILKLKD